MGSQQTFAPTPALITIPPNFPSEPTPGKIEILWSANTKNLYHRLSPYTDYDRTLLNKFIGDTEPFYYVYPDQNNKGLNPLKKYESRLFPAGSAPIDVIRISKFLVSGRGVGFLAKQFLLQTGNAFNETRVYNPTSPIVAAGMTLAIGTVRPQRNFDTSAGLGGLARTLIGSAIPDALFGAPKTNPPAGTVATALSDPMLTTGGKGLLRAGTANRATSHLQTAWPQNVKGSSTAMGFRAAVRGTITSIFANFIPQTQDGIQARSDEGTYGLMIGAGNSKFVYVGRDGSTVGFGQQWVAGSKAMRKNGQYPSRAFRTFTGPDGNPIQVTNAKLAAKNLGDVGSVGYTVAESTNANKPGFRYADSIGVQKDGFFEASEVLVQFGYYVDENNKFPTKQTTPSIINDLNFTLTKVLGKLRTASENLYTIDVPDDARVISSGNSTKNGYDRLFTTKDPLSTPINYLEGVLRDYRNVRTVDNTLTTDVVRSSLKLPTAGKFDAINTLTVLNKDKQIPNSRLKGWDEWQPYVDDQVALYFYDVVNEKYIPFRASIKGLSESANATWENLPFIGRGDMVYSYGGFNRNLSFTLHIVMNSIAELAPTWQRINYLSTVVKPSNYTTDTFNKVVNRFMIAPMFMFTLGDLYKDQPVLFQSVVMNVPDDASWETSNEFNSQEWQYLANYLKAPSAVYGQLPREVEIAVSVILLEKERAIVGGANFGHAPRTEDWSAWNSDTVPNAGEPNKFHKSLVVDVTSKNKNPVLLDAGQPFQNSPTVQKISNIA